MYWLVLTEIHQKLDEETRQIQELEELEDTLASQYLAKHVDLPNQQRTLGAIGQLLPIVPLTRLHEKPEVRVSIADITCDSDGKIGKYIENNSISDNIPMHRLQRGESYPIGMFLTGAYQDVMGDMHNLFGRLTEVHIFSHDDEPRCVLH